jgi:hypothetical protein
MANGRHRQEDILTKVPQTFSLFSHSQPPFKRRGRRRPRGRYSRSFRKFENAAQLAVSARS